MCSDLSIAAAWICSCRLVGKVVCPRLLPCLMCIAAPFLALPLLGITAAWICSGNSQEEVDRAHLLPCLECICCFIPPTVPRLQILMWSHASEVPPDHVLSDRSHEQPMNQQVKRTGMHLLQSLSSDSTSASPSHHSIPTFPPTLLVGPVKSLKKFFAPSISP